MQSPALPRVALITGAPRRVGRAVALRLALAGYDIAFTYLSSESAANELVAAIRAMGRACAAIRADLTNPATEIPAVFAAFSQAFSRLDLLMNNASLYQPDSPADAEQPRRLWSIHVESPLRLSRAFAAMLTSSGGHIVNMLDLLAERPRPGYLAYCASKAGLWNLTLGLARELAPAVTVNGIAPGVVEWPADSTAEEQQQYLRRVPLARPGTPGDVAETVLFLATGGNYITGQVIRLDGGRSIA